ncbi:ankyrin repeat-containing domain protein [Aspergillus crustosus]
MSLTDLPEELILQVMENFAESRASLASLMQCCSKTNRIGHPVLHNLSPDQFIEIYEWALPEELKDIIQNLLPYYLELAKENPIMSFAALKSAVRLGCADTTTFWLNHGAPVFHLNGDNDNSDNHMLLAAYHDTSEAVSALLQHNPDLTTVTVPLFSREHQGLVTGQASLLHIAVVAGASKIISFLLSRGQEVNIVGQNDASPLSLAVALGKHEISEMLIDAGANVNAADPNGWTPLTFAARTPDPDHFNLLLSRGADASIRDHTETLLWHAIERGNSTIVPLILDAGVDVNATLPNGETALFYAVQEGLPEVAQCLVSARTDVNIADADGKTALMAEAITESAEVTDVLIQAGADLKCQGQRWSDCPYSCGHGV